MAPVGYLSCPHARPTHTVAGSSRPDRLGADGAVAGGRLAAAVSRGRARNDRDGYQDAAWIDREFRAAEGLRIGFGFITWDLTRAPERLEAGAGVASRRGHALLRRRDAVDRDVAPAGEIVRRLVAETGATLARLRHGDGAEPSWPRAAGDT
jgi:hypothetical protein